MQITHHHIDLSQCGRGGRLRWSKANSLRRSGGERGQDFHLVGPLPMQRWPCGDEGFTARWHHAVDFPGADYVQMARGEGGKEPPLACPPYQGFAAHLSTCCFISRAWPPIRTADATARNRFV